MFDLGMFPHLVYLGESLTFTVWKKKPFTESGRIYLLKEWISPFAD
jgi:hypothetical protein